MRSLGVGVFAVAIVLCATPVSLRWSHDNDLMSLSAAFDTAGAAELNLPARHYRSARHGRYAYYSRLYDPYCNGPYTGGGWNGGTYYGGPWMDLRCYGAAY
jgi:hypothetical protein